MPTIRRPSRDQVRRALATWAALARPPDKENPAEAGPGTTGGSDAPEDADRAAPFLSDLAPFTDRADPCEAER